MLPAFMFLIFSVKKMKLTLYVRLSAIIVGTETGEVNVAKQIFVLHISV